MNRIVTGWRIVAGMAAAALVWAGAGCAARQEARPRPGASAIALEVAAQPKTGVKQRLVRVPVYDAAPRPAVPTGQYEHVDYSNLGDIIVWLQPAPENLTPPAPTNVTFDPSVESKTVHPASVGQEIVLRNRGQNGVAPYSVSDANDFQLAEVPPGGEARFTARGEGLIEVLGDPSLPPVALIYAAPSPWVARARAGETVVFNDVPPGDYEALSWHPRLPGKSVSVSLAPDQITRSTLVVGVNNIPTEAPQP
jgi:hypothetical protein